MRHPIRTLLLLTTIILLLTASFPSARAWTGDTHIWLSAKSVTYLPRDWQNLAFNLYSADLNNGTTAPDRVFRDFYNHVYHPRTGYGGAPKAITKWYGYFKGNLTLGNWKTSVYCAGVLAHYAEDIANPLHTDTSDAEEEIHSKYETDAYNHLSIINIAITDLDQVTNVTAYAISIATTVNPSYWNLVNNYTTYGWNQHVAQITQASMNLAVKTVASIWITAIKETGAQIPEFSSAPLILITCLTITALLFKRKSSPMHALKSLKNEDLNSHQLPVRS